MEKGKIDYQVPVTHLKGAKGDGGNRRYASSKQWDQKEMECDRREIEIYSYQREIKICKHQSDKIYNAPFTRDLNNGYVGGRQT